MLYLCYDPFQWLIKRLLTAADDALKSAAEAGNRRSKEVTQKFREAIHLFSSFATLDPNICGMVTSEAKMTDRSESPLTIFNALKKNLHPKVKFSSVSL